MTKEELKELQEWAVFTCPDEDVKNDIKNAVEEIKRLQKENETYREALKGVYWHTRTINQRHINWIAVKALKTYGIDMEVV